MIESILSSIAVGGVGVALAVGVLIVVFVARMCIVVGRPNELIVFSGQSQTLADGTQLGHSVLHGGWGFRIPVLHKVGRMSLTTIPLELNIQNAYTKGGIPLAVHAVANVKISSNPMIRNNAIERFLGKDLSLIRQVAKESLEGHLRGIVARMTPEEVNEDRLKFAEELVQEAGEDFDNIGLALDTLKVQSVSDDVAYLDSIGRERLANVLSTAEIAESTAKADAEEEQAKYNREGEVAMEKARTEIKRRENALRQVTAELEAKARSAEERAEQAALAARATAEQRLQEVRAKLEHLRLMADMVLPAEFERRASEMNARADAAQIAADGEAMAQVLDMMTEVWLRAGEDAKDIFLIQQLETVLSTVTERVKEMDIGEVTLLDGGNGQALPNHIAALPATVAAVLKEFRETTGVDITGILNSQTTEVQS